MSRTGQMCTGMYPRFNPLHPFYQERRCAIVEDMCRQFGDSKALQAVQLHIVYESPFWFGSLDWGYDAFSVMRFRDATGTPVPDFTGTTAPAQRYEWLMGNAREPWLDWRCHELTAFYARLAGILQAARPDLKLIVALRYLAEGDSRLGDWEKADRSMKRVYREAGIDFDQLAEIPNLQVQKYFYPNDITRPRSAGSGIRPRRSRPTRLGIRNRPGRLRCRGGARRSGRLALRRQPRPIRDRTGRVVPD